MAATKGPFLTTNVMHKATNKLLVVFCLIFLFKDRSELLERKKLEWM